MSEQNSQSYVSHTKWDPQFHFFIAPVALITAIAGIVHAVRNPSFSTAWTAIALIAALVAVFRMRVYSLRVQDRLIRLEERTRLATVLGDDLRPRINELSTSQLVGLRFASDSELASLAERALNEKLSRAEIKKAIVNWRADHLRV
jgi:hypothetical protein